MEKTNENSPFVSLHLGLLQAAITRMADSSFKCKAAAVILVTALCAVTRWGGGAASVGGVRRKTGRGGGTRRTSR